MPDQGAEGRLSPFLCRQRMNAVKPFLKGRVLDVGCGSGHLAAWLAPENYIGVEVDHESLERARVLYPRYRFEAEMPCETEKFDTIVALAVIEHVLTPDAFLQRLALQFRDVEDSYIVCTTPHPAVQWIHAMGAMIGLFSRHASEEHETLLNQRMLSEAGAKVGLRMVTYVRFLLGANQLAVFRADKNEVHRMHYPVS